MKAYYDTDVISANLSDAQPVVQAINDWVSNITDANIDQMIKDGKNETTIVSSNKTNKRRTFDKRVFLFQKTTLRIL